jgi:hypothetical protein
VAKRRQGRPLQAADGWGLAAPGPGVAEQALSAAGFTRPGFVRPVLLHQPGLGKTVWRAVRPAGRLLLVSLWAAALVLRLLG